MLRHKMASKGKSQYLVCPSFAHLELFLGDCLDVFFSNLLVYYTKLFITSQSSYLDFALYFFLCPVDPILPL